MHQHSAFGRSLRVGLTSFLSVNGALAQTSAATAAAPTAAQAPPAASPTLANASPVPAQSATLPPGAPVPAQAEGPGTMESGGEAPQPVAEPIPPRIGLQLGFRTGYALPMGNADGSTGGEMSNLYSGQVPIFFEIGGKPLPAIFLGGYLGLGFGGTDGQIGTACSASGVSCATVTVRAGFEILGYFSPGEKMSPWLGYGIGIEATSIAVSSSGSDGTLTASGPEFAHFMGGIDFRLSKSFGLGPSVDLSIAEYTTMKTDTPTVSQSSSLENKAIHEWLALGVRGVVFP
jgi:hypothetical protein